MYKCIIGWLDECMNRKMHGKKNAWIDERVTRMHERMDELRHEGMNRNDEWTERRGEEGEQTVECFRPALLR